MGRKALVPYGLYVAHGFFNPHFAKQTGVTAEDLELFWQALPADVGPRPLRRAGDAGLPGLYVFSHESPLGNAPAHTLFERVHVRPASRAWMPPRIASPTTTASTLARGRSCPTASRSRGWPEHVKPARWTTTLDAEREVLDLRDGALQLLPAPVRADPRRADLRREPLHDPRAALPTSASTPGVDVGRRGIRVVASDPALVRAPGPARQGRRGRVAAGRPLPRRVQGRPTRRGPCRPPALCPGALPRGDAGRPGAAWRDLLWRHAAATRGRAFDAPLRDRTESSSSRAFGRMLATQALPPRAQRRALPELLARRCLPAGRGGRRATGCADLQGSLFRPLELGGRRCVELLERAVRADAGRGAAPRPRHRSGRGGARDAAAGPAAAAAAASSSFGRVTITPFLIQRCAEDGREPRLARRTGPVQGAGGGTDAGQRPPAPGPAPRAVDPVTTLPPSRGRSSRPRSRTAAGAPARCPGGHPRVTASC